MRRSLRIADRVFFGTGSLSPRVGTLLCSSLWKKHVALLVYERFPSGLRRAKSRGEWIIVSLILVFEASLLDKVGNFG